jgi:4-amino-4-deoxy-L-arabinose transferase-like glycosyltransferase
MTSAELQTRSKRELLLLLVVVVGMLACFLDKAFTIDDPVYVAQARHIALHPLDPYGAVLNWTGTATPLHKFDKNPPLAAYYLALAGQVLGWSEIALHAASLLPAALCALGAYFLARRLTSHPLFAAFAMAMTPAFLVSATNVMCEVWMLAFWIWAAVAWLASCERDDPKLRWISMLCVVLATFAKYSAVALVPLFFVDGLVRSRKLDLWALPFALPIAAFVAYDLWSRRVYGVGLLSDAMGFSGTARAVTSTGTVQSLVTGLAFTGGCLVIVLGAAPLLWRPWITAGGAIFVIVAALGIDMSALLGDGSAAARAPGVSWQFWLFALGGMGVLALAISDLARRRSADSLLLCLWVVGVFAFAAIVNWTSNARSILPMAPAVACLVIRRLEDRGVFESAQRWKSFVAALAVSAAIAVLCAQADFRWANQVRDAARALPSRDSVQGRRALCIVHWGFQYYLEQQGVASYDRVRDRVSPGDVLLVAENNTNVAQPPGFELRIVDQLQVENRFGMHTVAPSIGGSFYASVFGPLPFAFGTPKPDAYFVLEVGERKRGETR